MLSQSPDSKSSLNLSSSPRGTQKASDCPDTGHHQSIVLSSPSGLHCQATFLPGTDQTPAVENPVHQFSHLSPNGGNPVWEINVRLWDINSVAIFLAPSPPLFLTLILVGTVFFALVIIIILTTPRACSRWLLLAIPILLLSPLTVVWFGLAALVLYSDQYLARSKMSCEVFLCHVDIPCHHIHSHMACRNISCAPCPIHYRIWEADHCISCDPDPTHSHISAADRCTSCAPDPIRNRILAAPCYSIDPVI